MCKALVHKKLEDCIKKNKETKKLEYFRSYSSTHGLGLSEISFSDLSLLFSLLKRLNINEKEKLLQLERIYFQAHPVSCFLNKMAKKKRFYFNSGMFQPHSTMLKL